MNLEAWRALITRAGGEVIGWISSERSRTGPAGPVAPPAQIALHDGPVRVLSPIEGRIY